MNNVLYFSFLLPTLLHSELPPLNSSSVSSKIAAYDGRLLILDGDVELDLGIGKLFAQHAAIEKPELGAEIPCSIVDLQEDVRVSLKQRAELLCEKAHFDFSKLLGELLPKIGGQVIYRDSIQKEQGKQEPFQLSGNRVELHLTKQTKEEGKVEYQLDEILAYDDVCLDSNQDIHVSADRALFQRKTAQSSTPIVTAHPKDDQGLCLITHQKDHIDAKCIILDIQHALINLQSALGSLYSTLIPQQKEPLKFRSDLVTWYNLEHRLTLLGNVHVEEPSLGTIESAQLEMVQSDEHQLKSLKAQGKTTLEHLDLNTGSKHTLTCLGSFNIDEDKQSITLKSPLIEGKVPFDQQLYYAYEDIAVNADVAKCLYQKVEHAAKLSSLSLEGNVRLFSLDPKQTLRCAIADNLVYHPETNTFLLSSKSKRKVLFWNEEEGLSISAQHVEITKDASGKESVKSKGNVKFAFSTAEHQLLQKIFPFYQPPEASHATEE